MDPYSTSVANVHFPVGDLLCNVKAVPIYVCVWGGGRGH